MSWVMGSKMHSSPKHPDTIHNCTPVPPTALQESTDIFMHRGKDQDVCYSPPPYNNGLILVNTVHMVECFHLRVEAYSHPWLLSNYTGPAPSEVLFG